MRPDAASNAPQYASCFVSRWGHDRTPAYPHDQVASRVGLPPRFACVFAFAAGPISTTLAHSFYEAPCPPPPPFCCTFSSPTVSSIRRAYDIRRRVFSTLDSSPRRYTHCAWVFDAPLHFTLLHLRTPPTSTCAYASLAAGIRATRCRPLPARPSAPCLASHSAVRRTSAPTTFSRR
ncbi:hypothetical protein B0H13DRAFT_2039175 [Mycena leptocephala]|nr:hypothetical protein B0H13DRAFT_2039175 [Mycena leptocephala]